MKPLTVLAVLVGIAFFVLAYVYVTTAASALPHLLPGYDAARTTPHVKHAILSVILGLGSFILAWFSTGPRSATTR